MSNIEFYVPKGKDDHERAILPALMYVGGSNEYIKVHIFILGWWKWGVGLKIRLIK